MMTTDPGSGTPSVAAVPAASALSAVPVPGGAFPVPPQRLPLRRPSYRAPVGRLLGGVCAGTAVHLGQDVKKVRVLAVVLTLAGGAGALLYLLLLLAVPAGDPWAEAAGAVPVARARLASRPRSLTALSSRRRSLVGGGALLTAALLLGAWQAGHLSATEGSTWVLPLVVITCGAALAWSQIDAVASPERDLGVVLRLSGGVVLAAVGILLWVGADTPPRVLITSALTGGALVLGIGLVLAPLWLRTNRALADTRAAEAREAERADIAAHLHDSVLQTLTLIRKKAQDPEAVARLARSQERELRAWLYTDRAEAGASAADAVRELVAEIEDRHGVPVELVVVGDRLPDPATEVILAASREALSNAVRHGAPPVSVYAEITPSCLEVFVRDRGAGFDPETVAPDRHGVRESIIGRLGRHGGSARVRRLERGTEISLTLPTFPPPLSGE